MTTRRHARYLWLLLTGSLLATTPSIASAQENAPDTAGPKTAPPAALTEQARALWYRGVNAFRAGDYEQARQAFDECYKLMPKTDVLRNLSISELESGHYVSGARHLSQLIATPDALNPTARKEAEKRLAQAEAQVGRVSVRVDVEGADVLVDGTAIGKSPLTGTWYIEPGQHIVAVRKPGYPEESRQVFALAGVDIPVEVSLEKLQREKEAAAAGTARAGAPQPTDAPGTGHSETMSTGSVVLLAATGTVAVVGLVMGITMRLSASDHDTEADKLAVRFNDPGACAPDSMFYGGDCQKYADHRHDAIIQRRWSTAGYIGFGVAAASAVGYALWLGLRGSSEPVQATFAIDANGAGIGVQGAF